MKAIIIGIVISFFSLITNAQERYSRAKIWFKDKDLSSLLDIGLAVDHGNIKQNTYIISDFSETEIQKAESAGFKVDILIKDVKAHYVKQINASVEKNLTCFDTSKYVPSTPSHFKLGTMAGYYTYQEYLDVLDSMFSQYPHLITERAPISDTLTHEGRPLYFVKISNQPQLPQVKPKVLYTALHHAREPGSLSETIFFMWYLLENYGTDAEITYLVDELELLFVPIVNPDGYITNEINDPAGGGMFRKNKNPNVGTINPGVDLNRNYSYQWNTTGVSQDEDSDVFPGVGAFSEPETQNIKKIAEQWGIQFALNAHTHGGMLLYPFGASVNDFTADHSYFNAISSQMVIHNHYINQKSSGLYPAAGDSDDYLYHDHGVFAMTPEVSHGGFWAPENQIIDDCRDMLYSNIVLAHLPLVYGVTKSLDETLFLNDLAGAFNFEIKRLGQKAGTLTVSIVPIIGIQSVGNSVDFDLAIEETQAGAISYVLNSDIQYGDEVKYELITDNGKWKKKDTITKIYGSPTVQFYDPANTLNHWIGSWEQSTTEFYSPDYSFSDSPTGNYQNNQQTFFQLKDTIDLSFAHQALVSFRAKWELENNYDYVQFMVSTDFGASWTSQCGKYTNLGAAAPLGNQPLEPLYDGVQMDWVLEEIDLSEYLGQKIMMKFSFVSDEWVNGKGFYFDDFQLMYNLDSSLYSMSEGSVSFRIYPNPAHNSFTVSGQNILQGDVYIYNTDGQLVMAQKNEGKSKEIVVDTLRLDKGVYFVLLKNENTVSSPERLVILR